MKIEVISNIELSNCLSPIITITKNEYRKADLSEINDVVSMLCCLNNFGRELTETEHKEILAQLDNVGDGYKVLFAVTATPTKPDPYPWDIEKNFEVSLLTSLNPKKAVIIAD
ncbi:MAG: hypothetical protein VZR06_17155 [Butyrivibrio sp.]|jgi:hypothetical protein|nr:hypothetical protein [Lachnospiraceae bacterium]MEE3450970.1 hypothetical protein [Acutalibacteraceae bacterium]MEE3496885.1 hypothetical protein [Butyrivibrio sp.]